MECLSFCIAHAIDLIKLDQKCKQSLLFKSVRLRNVLKLTDSQFPEQMGFIFNNGTIVTWNIKRHKIQDYFNIIQPFSEGIIQPYTHDEFSYQIGNTTSIQPHDYFDVDCLSIDIDNDELKLSLSYGFSQSVKLQYFETRLESLIDTYSPLIKSLSKRGQLSLSRKGIRQIIGEILGAKSEMNLISNFLYNPKYFWQHPTLEEYFLMLERISRYRSTS